MRRILTTGLLVSTILALTVPAAAQRTEGRERGAWNGGERQQRSADPDRGSRRGSDGDRSSRADPRPAPQRAPSAVQNRPVPASNANQWPDGRGSTIPGANNPANPGSRAYNGPGSTTQRAPQVQQPRNNGNWQQRDARRGDNDRTGDRNWDRNRNPQGNDRNWRDNDRQGNGRDRDWRNNDRDRSTANRDWRNDNRGQTWRNNDRERSYSYQGRLQDRDRWSNQQRWSNSWRNDRRYNWQSYRNQHRSVYRMPSYSAPYGWSRGYSRFSIGIFLNNILFDQSYWIDDPYYYRLPPAYGSLRWVRYYDDALLVDLRDGYVVDVIHDFFW